MKKSILLFAILFTASGFMFGQSADLRTSTTQSWLSLTGGGGGDDDVHIFLNRSDDNENATIRYSMDDVPTGFVVLGNYKHYDLGMLGNENFRLDSKVSTGIFPNITTTTKTHLFCKYDGISYLNGVTGLELKHNNSTRLQINGTEWTAGLSATKRSYLTFHHDFGAPNGGITFENNGDPNGSNNSERWTWYVNNGNGSMVLYYKTNQVGTFATTGVYTSSDRRLKDNISNMSSTLSKVTRLEPKTYTYKADPMQKQTIGLIAQDVKTLFPELVIDSYSDDKEDDTHALNYGALGVVAIKAIQEQQDIIDAQQKKIDALNARLSAIEKLLEK